MPCGAAGDGVRFEAAAGQLVAGFLLMLLMLLFFLTPVVPLSFAKLPFHVVLSFLSPVGFLIMVMFVFLGAQVCRFCIARDVVVVAVLGRAVQMPNEAATASVELEREGVAACRAVVARLRSAGQAVGRFLWNASGLHVHGTADGTGTVQQDARTAEHLNPFGNERFDGDRMVGTHDRCIHRIQAILHDAHPRAGQAMHHRPADDGTECRLMDAGLPAERGAEVDVSRPVQCFAVQTGRWHRQTLVAQRMRLDDQYFHIFFRHCRKRGNEEQQSGHEAGRIPPHASGPVHVFRGNVGGRAGFEKCRGWGHFKCSLLTGNLQL